MDDLTAEIIKLKDIKNWSWAKIDRHYPDIKRETLRSKYRYAKAQCVGIQRETNSDVLEIDTATNSQTISSRSPRIWTLEQLLEACEVDGSVWKVDHYIVNKWEVGAKPEWKDLTWEKGRIEKGYVKSDGLHVEPLIQVKAWLVRIDPLAIFPTIQPIACEPIAWEIPPPRSEGIGRALVFGDAHFGFGRDLRTHELTPLHDRRVLSVVLQLAEYMQPDRIDILGDMLDLTDWNDKYLRSPEFTECTQPAIEAGHRFHKRLREVAPGAQIRAHAGNHEGRMERAIIRHLGAAYDLRAADELEMPPALSVPRLLALHQLGIEWMGDYPDDLDWINDGLCISHGELARSVPGETARAVVRDADESAIVGHTHQVEMASRTLHIRGGERTITAVSPGCCCHIDGRVPAAKARMQWQNGCAVVDYEIGGRAHTVHPLLITASGLVWDGNRFEGGFK